MEYLTFLNKWLHLMSISGVLGGIIFAWIVLMPIRKAEGEEGETAALLWRRFGIALGALWAVALLTGFYNFYLVTPQVNGSYQMLLGMKMSLAIIMFLISLAIAHPMPAVARFFRDRRAWLLALLTLGAVVIGLSAHLNLSRLSGKGLKAPANSVAPL